MSRFQESGDVSACVFHLTVAFRVKRKTKRSTQMCNRSEMDPVRVLVGSMKGQYFGVRHYQEHVEAPREGLPDADVLIWR